MGLIKELLLLPVAPVRFTVWVVDRVAEEADRQSSGTGPVVQRLRDLEAARREGAIDEDEAAEAEGRIIEARLAGEPAIGRHDDVGRDDGDGDEGGGGDG